MLDHVGLADAKDLLLVCADGYSIPWPFQLTEIRRFDPDDYFAAARPSPAADSQIQDGFELYKAHCGQCHRMRGNGGSVGPELDRALSRRRCRARRRKGLPKRRGRIPAPIYLRLRRPEATLVGVGIVHALAALKHHLLDRDATLIRMLGIPPRTEPARPKAARQSHHR